MFGRGKPNFTNRTLLTNGGIEMGNFKIVIDAVGGHGDNREVGPGGDLTFSEHGSPDKTAYEFVQSLKTKGWFQNGGSAVLVHWPGEKGQVVDDLLNGKRKYGSFRESPPDEDAIMQFFASSHLPADLANVSRPFTEMARSIVQAMPRNAERTVALRKLLEAKDAAVRAYLSK
jgi:hypothetical protein